MTDNVTASTEWLRLLRGERAYSAYAKSTGGKTYDGREMPEWNALTPAIKEAWAASTEANPINIQALAYALYTKRVDEAFATPWLWEDLPAEIRMRYMREAESLSVRYAGDLAHVEVTNAFRD